MLADEVAQCRRPFAVAFTLGFVRNDALRRGVEAFAQATSAAARFFNLKMRRCVQSVIAADLPICDGVTVTTSSKTPALRASSSIFLAMVLMYSSYTAVMPGLARQK